ncbi:hypothetical protein BJY21_000935 [Kineosphaera limosa]|uniref:Uncharacterized protein n=1 Tax=Kineosphaera limosa NBRC 100340 TaxID=1184609 RepID=K6WPX5_9MICO|nr:hypothetical protein [Kineosphaera limosa]NYD99750.1 hypothetical protein [Kineosphaera limosa]GAB95851.1 hypothetical protein KILIM_028_00050 [Kineosphaera limosa NBRC 100340]
MATDEPSTDSLMLPRRPWRPLVTATAAIGAALMAGAVALGTVPTFLVTGLAMVLLAGGWVLLLGLPSPRGTTAVLAGASLILLGGGVLSQEARTMLLPGAVALAMIVEFVHQLARRDGRPRLVESVSGSITGITLLTSGACVLLLTASPAGVATSVTIFAAVAVASLADVGLRWGGGGPLTGALAIGLGALVAALLGPAVGAELPLAVLALAGGLAAGSSYALRQVQSVLPTLFGRRAQIASGVSSVLAPGVLAYALTWIALGPDMMAVMH